MTMDYEKTGILQKKDLVMPSDMQLKKGVVISECIQDIPCNPCVDSCPVSAISMKDINSIPIIDYDACIGCGKCIGVCPGLALFLIKVTDDSGLVTIPFEFLPLPDKGQQVEVCNREGRVIGTGIVNKVRKSGKTSIITVEVDKDHVMDVRNIRIGGNQDE